MFFSSEKLQSLYFHSFSMLASSYYVYVCLCLYVQCSVSVSSFWDEIQYPPVFYDMCIL
jgi:hypothetical protein